jgi:hypothetical protein
MIENFNKKEFYQPLSATKFNEGLAIKEKFW